MTKQQLQGCCFCQLQGIQAANDPDALPKISIDFFRRLTLPSMDPGRNNDGQQITYDIDKILLSFFSLIRGNTKYRAYFLEIPAVVLCKSIQPIAFFQSGKQFRMFHDQVKKGKQNVFLWFPLGKLPCKIIKDLIHLPEQHIYRCIKKSVKGAAADRGSTLNGSNGNPVGRGIV